MRGFEALQDQMSTDATTSPNSNTKQFTNNTTTINTNPQLEGLESCSKALNGMQDHYNTFQVVSNHLILGSSSSFGIGIINNELARKLDDYEHYGRKIKLACKSSNPKASVVERNFQRAAKV